VGKPQTELGPFRDELGALRKALGNRIRQLRTLRGWSQEVFAAKAHVHRTFAGSLERGEKNVSFHALVLIARCFGMTLAELLAGLEAGEPARSRARNRRSSDSVDRERLLSEVAALEANVRALREIALGTEGPRPASESPRKRSPRSR
jgi:transcriptional regulator with XRE-family HTH domain